MDAQRLGIAGRRTGRKAESWIGSEDAADDQTRGAEEREQPSVPTCCRKTVLQSTGDAYGEDQAEYACGNEVDHLNPAVLAKGQHAERVAP